MLPSRDPSVGQELVTSLAWLDPTAEDDGYLLPGNVKTCLQRVVLPGRYSWPSAFIDFWLSTSDRWCVRQDGMMPEMRGWTMHDNRPAHKVMLVLAMPDAIPVAKMRT